MRAPRDTHVTRAVLAIPGFQSLTEESAQVEDELAEAEAKNRLYVMLLERTRREHMAVDQQVGLAGAQRVEESRLAAAGCAGLSATRHIRPCLRPAPAGDQRAGLQSDTLCRGPVLTAPSPPPTRHPRPGAR